MEEQNSGIWKSASMKIVLQTLGVLLVIFVAVKVVGEIKSIGYIGKSSIQQNAITVSGKGEITTKPDIATFSFTVSEEAPVVSEAQSKSAEKMNAILAFVKQSGVAEKDVTTSSYNIYPRYEYEKISAYGYGKQVLAAYVVSQSIEIKVRKLEDAGKLLSGIGEYGATNVSGLSFSVDKQDVLAREARDKAIADAREQAIKLADSLGVKLGTIINFSESTPYRPYPMMYAKEASVMGMGGDGAAPSIPAGENKITSDVTITYEIR